MKKIVFAISILVLACTLALSAQKLSPDATETPLLTTNAYTALNWNFGAAGRKYAQGDTLTFVADSAASPGYVRSRDFGPKARNVQSVNLYNPDSVRMCIEMSRVDADTNTTVGFFDASMNGGNFFAFPSVPTSTDLGVTGRGLYCITRSFVPGSWIKPQIVTTTPTDTNVVYSAVLFGVRK